MDAAPPPDAASPDRERDRAPEAPTLADSEREKARAKYFEYMDKLVASVPATPMTPTTDTAVARARMYELMRPRRTLPVYRDPPAMRADDDLDITSRGGMGERQRTGAQFYSAYPIVNSSMRRTPDKAQASMRSVEAVQNASSGVLYHRATSAAGGVTTGQRIADRSLQPPGALSGRH